jgi:hypothetical protein
MGDALLTPARSRRGRTWPVALASALASCGGGPAPTELGGAAASWVEPATPEADGVVEEPVQWIPAHQGEDGRWSAAGFDRWRMPDRPPGLDPGLGQPHHDVAVTAMAARAIAGTGHTVRTESHPGRALAWAIAWLRSVQRAEGALSDRAAPLWATNHALGSLALTAAADAVEDDALRQSARRAVDFYVRSRANGERAWRNERGPGGLPPFAWMAFSARESRDRAAPRALPTPGPVEARDAAEVDAWLEAARAEDDGPGRLGLALYLRSAPGGAWRSEAVVVAAAARLAARPPAWDPEGKDVDLAGWWLATEGLYRVGGETWKTWNAALRAAVVDSQRMDTTSWDFKGSWDPVGDWSGEGGRVFSTAAAALTLLVYYRYDRVLGTADGLAAGATRPQRSVPSPFAGLPERRIGTCR